MKVLILTNSAAGFYSFRKELVERLVDGKNDVFLSVPNHDKVSDLVDLGCHFIDTPVDRRGTNLLADLKLFLKYRSLLKKIKPDVVLAYTIKPNIYGGIAARLAKVKCISNITGLGTAVENPGVLQKISIRLYRMAMKKTHCIFFQNEANKAFFKEHRIGSEESYNLIPGSGVNLSRYQPLPFPAKKTIEFVFIARIMKAKGIEQYLDAAKVIKQKYPDTVFHICGYCEESYLDEIEQLDKEGIIKYHGVISDIREIHKQVHCIVHPSYYPEGMSNVLLEACASARPIITTGRPGCGEIVDDEVNGFVVNERDSEDLMFKLEEFIKLSLDKRGQMGLAARLKVENVFDREIVIQCYLENIAKN